MDGELCKAIYAGSLNSDECVGQRCEIPVPGSDGRHTGHHQGRTPEGEVFHWASTWSAYPLHNGAPPRCWVKVSYGEEEARCWDRVGHSGPHWVDGSAGERARIGYETGRSNGPECHTMVVDPVLGPLMCQNDSDHEPADRHWQLTEDSRVEWQGTVATSAVPGGVANPNRTQVGGDHYTSLAIDPWTIIEKNGLDFFEGTVLKYLLRWRKKGGVEDLKKARHTLDRMIDAEERREKQGE